MILDADETEWALYAVTELVERRRAAGVPVPAELVALSRKIDLASLMSASGHVESGFGCGGSSLDSEVLIGSREAADILHLSSTRQVRRLARQGCLPSQKRGRDYLFKLSTVVEYAEEREHGRHRPSLRRIPA